MKRLLTSATMFLCSLLTFAQFSGSGSGTESDPYLILNPIHMNQIRNFLNQEGVYFKMMADVDLTEFIEDENPSQGWQPIGSSSSAAFKGILDGNGKTISGLWINRSNNDNIGLFGCANGATIKNVNIGKTSIKGQNNTGGLCGDGNGSSFDNCKMLSGKIEGNSYVGGICGNGGSFINCSSNAEVLATGECVGGITGSASGDISRCRVNCKSISGESYIGGITGKYSLNSTLVSSFAYTEITGNSYIGGIVGYISYYSKEWRSYNKYGNPTYDWNYGTSVENSGFGGKIKGTSYIGGIVGAYWDNKDGYGFEHFNECFVQKCFAMGEIIASADCVGGIVGYVYSRVNLLDCSYAGTITAKDYVGGIAGHYDWYSNNFASIMHSYSNATINGYNYVGGIVGYNLGGHIKSCVAISDRITANDSSYGRIFGYNKYGIIGQLGSSEDNKAYNRTIVICQGVAQEISDDEQNGTGVSSTTLKLKATYVAMGWDFTDIWEILETECYPYFKWQTAPPVITSKVVSGATTISGKCVNGGRIKLEIDGIVQETTSSGNSFSFNVSPLQVGQEVRVSAKADGKEQSYYATEIVAFLGSGKENDPYQVYTAADLTSAYRKGNYKLVNDIDLTDYINKNSPSEGWQSIGRNGSETIHFDGDGHKITGLWCNSTRDNTGLFSCFANGTIKNLIVETAKGKQVKGGANTGILIGKMINGTIENCRVSGTVADGTPVGGLVGLFDGGKISLSQANVTINTTGEKSYVGGLVGEITGGEIDQCVTLGNLTATGKASYVGGLVGKNSATVTNCYSNANVTSTYNAAGLIAYNYSVVDKCYATGNLFSNNYGAGVIGINDGVNAVVKNCVAMNNKIDVIWESQQEEQSGGYGMRIVGGIPNDAPAPELNNYALKTMQVSLNNVPKKVYDDIMNGVGKNGSDLVKGSTYQELGWVFSSIWSIKEGESYPSLKKNAVDVPITSADDSGQCGDRVTYMYYEATQTLIISGSGRMEDWSSPWNSYKTSIQTIIIESGVTSIGAGAFQGCSSLTSITIPNDVTSIGQNAFWGCSGLTSITFPNSMASIGTYAFRGCSGLTSVVIPKSVTTIGGYSWSIPFGNPFSSCSSLRLIVVESGNPKYDSRDDCNTIIETSSNMLIAGCKNTTIPNSVTSIGRDAFNGCSELTDITIPNSITSIGSDAFNGCSALTSITFPNSMASIGTYAFAGCNSLTSVISEIINPFKFSEDVFPDDVYNKATLTVPWRRKTAYQSTNYWNKFTSIVEAEFNGLSKTIHVSMAGTLPNLISESEKYSIQELTLTGELNGTDFRLLRDMAGNNYLGQNTAGILKVLNLANAKVIAGGERYLDTGSTHLEITRSDEIPEKVFFNCNLMEIYIPNSVTNIGDYAFWNCSGLYSIAIPNSVTSIGRDAFNGCSDLTVITIPTSVTNIGSHAFYCCSGLTSITIPNSVTSIEWGTFYGCSGLTSITIPNSVTSIGGSSFSNCTNLISITIPNSVTCIEMYAFYECTSLISITIPNSVITIGEGAFSYCYNLSSIAIPNSVTSIGNSAFTGCYDLSSVTSEIVKPFKISENVFPDYSKPTLTVPAGTKSAYQSTAGWNKFTNIVEKEAENVVQGDANGDKKVNVSDIVEIVSYIMGKPSAKFVEVAADMNGDGEVNVTDIVKVVSIIMSSNNARQRASMIESTDNDRLTMVENENHALSICLNNESGYVASQFDIHLSAGQTLEGIMLNSIRSKDHVLTYTKTNNDTYRVVVYSLGNQAYTGNHGELLSIQVSGTGNVDIDNILFVTSGQNEKRFASLHSSTTGINAVNEIEAMDIYSMDGRLVRKQVKTTNDLKKGVYIVNGKKQVVR